MARSTATARHDEWHECGVGLILSKRVAKALIGWKPVRDGINTDRYAKATVVQSYALTESAEDAAKDEFYKQLQDTFDDIQDHDLKVVLVDFNAQLGGDRRGLESVIGATHLQTTSATAASG